MRVGVRNGQKRDECLSRGRDCTCELMVLTDIEVAVIQVFLFSDSDSDCPQKLTLTGDISCWMKKECGQTETISS